MQISLVARRLAVAVSVLLLLITGVWLYAETRWAKWTPAAPVDAFLHGPIGLETVPLKYAVVLEQLSGAAFRTGFEDGRSMWRTYGFIDNPRSRNDRAPACEENAADKLPVGVNVSNYVPLTAIQTPVKFAGLTCASCHTGVLRDAAGSVSEPILGMGNPELDVIAWSDGVRSAVLDPTLSAGTILAAYDKQCGGPSGLYAKTVGRLLDRVLIGAWLGAIRSSVAEGMSQYDMPYHGAQMKSATDIPAGPARTRPFRSVVRTSLNLPAAENMALSKIPVVFEQSTSLRPHSQFDGSIKDPTTRALIAAYTSGSSLQSLSKPEVVHNIKAAALFTERLGIDNRVLGYRDLFPGKAPDPQRVAAGRAVYEKNCNSCHGNRPAEDAPWNLTGADRWGQLSPIDPAPGQPAIGTDPARLKFRYATMLPLALWTSFPGWATDLAAQKTALQQAQDKAQADGDLAGAYFWQQQQVALNLLSRKYRLGHPLYFAADTIRYNQGYINNPIPRAFLRAPYLHNASVPTLRQLIHLDRRPDLFCRGETVYDPDAVGIKVVTPDAAGACPVRQPFRFDVALPGNSNRGHDYPWRYDDPARDPRALEDLLEYLKTL